MNLPLLGQKAPSTKRCIKTDPNDELLKLLTNAVRKHRAPKGALRLGGGVLRSGSADGGSESTERQKAH